VVLRLLPSRRVGLGGLTALLGLALVACSPAGAGPASPPDATGQAVAVALEQRALAVVAHDRGGLAATAAPSATPAVRELGARTATLPFTAWSYVVESDDPGPAAGERSVTAVVRYRLRSDPADVTARRRLILVPAAKAPGGWQVLSDDALGAALPWDLGPVGFASGRRAVVLSTGSSAGAGAVTMAGLAADADAAADAVTRVWGSGWDQAPVVVAVSGPQGLATLLGRPLSGVTGLVAITTPDRVYVDVAAYAALDPRGRHILLTHETTHLVTKAGADSAIPQWLKEGFADYVGFQGSANPVDQAAASLLARVRRSGPPAALPDDAAFDPGTVGVSGPPAAALSSADAYAGAWLACSLIAARVGQNRLVAVYRASSAGLGTPTVNVDRALRRLTGESLDQWTRAWRADLERLAR
jgi:hypothetical protein